MIVVQLTNKELDGHRWYEFANCLGLDTNIFYPTINGENTGHTDYKTAKKICARCQVRDLCLMAALAEETTEVRVHGMRGGKSPLERARLLSIITQRNYTQWRNRATKNASTASLEAAATVAYADGVASRLKYWDNRRQNKANQSGLTQPGTL